MDGVPFNHSLPLTDNSKRFVKLRRRRFSMALPLCLAFESDSNDDADCLAVRENPFVNDHEIVDRQWRGRVGPSDARATRKLHALTAWRAI